MPTYNYVCENEECLTKSFKFTRPMSEYQEPACCPQCDTQCQRATNDFGANFKLKGIGWYRDGYNGANWHSEATKAGKDPYKSN